MRFRSLRAARAALTITAIAGTAGVIAAAAGIAAPTQGVAGAPYRGCVNGPLYDPDPEDGVLFIRAGIPCGAFGEVPHTVTLEMTGPGGYRSVDTDTWFPGSGFWEVEVSRPNVDFGTPADPAKWDACVTVSPYDSTSWLKSCISADTYARNGLVSVVRGPQRWTSGDQ